VLALAAPARGDSDTLNRRLLRSTGWINCPQPDGGNSWGTCWVLDREERLVVTNKHVVDAARTAKVDFPRYTKGKLVTAVDDYLPHPPIHGRVIYFDEKRDLALVQLEELPEGIVALPLAAEPALPGQAVYSLGNATANTDKPRDARLWRFLDGRAELRYFDVVTFDKAPIQRVEATSIRTNLKTAPGDSGGPVVNTRGELVAVHSNADHLSSFSIDVSEVKQFVERSRQRRRPPAGTRELSGTWTLATTDELGRVHFDLTVCTDGTCHVYREMKCAGKFERTQGNTVNVAVPGMNMTGETTLRWERDDQFSFVLNGVEFTATRR
jgi:S1-C subfamily serine protease